MQFVVRDLSGPHCRQEAVFLRLPLRQSPSTGSYTPSHLSRRGEFNLFLRKHISFLPTLRIIAVLRNIRTQGVFAESRWIQVFLNSDNLYVAHLN